MTPESVAAALEIARSQPASPLPVGTALVAAVFGAVLIELVRVGGTRRRRGGGLPALLSRPPPPGVLLVRPHRRGRDPPVECWAAKIAAEHGFADVRHGRDDMSTSRFT
jgi:hypothetical protein